MTDLAELRALPVEERLKLIEELWDSIDIAADAPPVPDWHREEIDRRLDRLDSDVSIGASWPDIRRRIVGKP
jgi:putative addiction module component (TIGR02574 family)